MLVWWVPAVRLDLVMGVNGTATRSLSIPGIPAFAGLRVFHQAAPPDP